MLIEKIFLSNKIKKKSSPKKSDHTMDQGKSTGTEFPVFQESSSKVVSETTIKPIMYLFFFENHPNV